MIKLRLTERARKFLREVGSIVLGVLIALGIGEVADTLRHRFNASRAFKIVRAEMGVNGVYLEERMMKGRCISRRLEELRRELAAARVDGALRKLKTIGRPNTRPLTNVGWINLVSSGEIIFTRKDDLEYGRSYAASLEKYLTLQDQEQLAWAKLRVLESRPDRLSDDLVAEVEITIEEARDYAETMNIIARRLWSDQRYLGINADYAYFTGASRDALVRAVKTSAVCLPLA